MALAKYKEKRNFKESPEPTGGKPDSNKLCFVIQKHDATNLHYDFRLEMEGVLSIVSSITFHFGEQIFGSGKAPKQAYSVLYNCFGNEARGKKMPPKWKVIDDTMLKSWAVPKGPSTDPSIKRLAIKVEDHPFDYRKFEGIIPSGYGAGTVIVWDEGSYELADADGKDKKAQEKEFIKGIHSGKLHVVLHGKKLKGEFALIKTQGKAENAWLLFKIKDEYGSKEDITLKDKSVISQKTLLDKIVTNGKRNMFPSKLSPMLATMVDKPFDQERWQYEIKWDGYRAVAFCDKNKVELKSRNDLSFAEKFYSVHKAVQQWNINAVVDGEVVVLDENGKSKIQH